MTTDEENEAPLSSHDASPEARSAAAAAMGRARSEKKAAAVRENGKKGGRPPGQKLTEDQKAKMRQAQAARRLREKEGRA